MLRRPLSLALITTAASLLGCGADAPLPIAEPVAPPPSATTPSAAAIVTTEPSAASGARAAFRSPGGMWMPQQLAGKAAELKSLGLEVDPAALTDPTSPILASVVSLGGCSASFVSKDGLIVTNHHCALGALQYNATPGQNLISDGYLAKTRADEKWSGPTSRIFVTRSIRDVTSEIRAGLGAAPDDLARHKLMEQHTKDLVAACEKGKPSVRCSVASFFGGTSFGLVEQLEIKDVRLVYAPADGVGNFGGEIDNWRWPRHAGDFSFLRAYVGKDGAPAEHADTNVPYQPPHWLKLASKPLEAGDLVLVAGYPGRTNRLRTAGEVDEAVNWYYPRLIDMSKQYIDVYESAAKRSKDLAIKANNSIRGFNNRLTKIVGIMDGLVKGGLAAKKKTEEQKLAAWIEADPQRKKDYGGSIEQMAALQASRLTTREHDAAIAEELQVVKLLDAAMKIVRMAEERSKPDVERDPDFQERNWKRIEQSLTSLQKQYDRSIETAVFALALERALRLTAAERPETVALVFGKKHVQATDTAEIQKAAADLYATTTLEDEAKRVELFQKASSADLKKSTDPLIRIALALRPAVKATEDREDALVAGMAMARPHYFAAVKAMGGGSEIAPDANSTLRITYGTVRGYRPTPTANEYRPFTTLAEMVAKAKPEAPFLAPKGVLDAAAQSQRAPYLDAHFGDVPVDFIADLDITGGNSGSATLNARGELTGLAFDGNYESMASDWIFLPEVTRSIHVDMRYVLWNLDAVAHAGDLLRELGATASF